MWCSPETACGFLHSSVARGTSVVRIGRYEPLTYYAKSADIHAPQRSAAQGIDPRSRRGVDAVARCRPARRWLLYVTGCARQGAVAVQRAFTAVK